MTKKKGSKTEQRFSFQTEAKAGVDKTCMYISRTVPLSPVSCRAPALPVKGKCHGTRGVGYGMAVKMVQRLGDRTGSAAGPPSFFSWRGTSAPDLKPARSQRCQRLQRFSPIVLQAVTTLYVQYSTVQMFFFWPAPAGAMSS